MPIEDPPVNDIGKLPAGARFSIRDHAGAPVALGFVFASSTQKLMLYIEMLFVPSPGSERHFGMEVQRMKDWMVWMSHHGKPLHVYYMGTVEL